MMLRTFALSSRFLTFSGVNSLRDIESLFRYGATAHLRIPRRPLCRFVLEERSVNNRLSSIARSNNIVSLLRVKYLTSYSSQREGFSGKLWRVVKGILIFTGGIFWVVPVFLYGGYLTGILHVDFEERDSRSRGPVDRSEFHNRILAFYNIPEEGDVETRARELSDKDYAFLKLWEKLRNEEGVLERFGKPVKLSGYHIPAQVVDNMLDDEARMSEINHEQKEKVWNVSCYVEGPKLSGLLDVEFTWVNNKWIPVSLQLEGLQKSGDVICNVSAPLPNGLTRFTRLCNIY